MARKPPHLVTRLWREQRQVKMAVLWPCSRVDISAAVAAAQAMMAVLGMVAEAAQEAAVPAAHQDASV